MGKTRLEAGAGAESPVINATLELTGRKGDPSRLPTRRLDESEGDELRTLLIDIGVLGVQSIP